MGNNKDSLIAGKRILFFAPAFFGYENKIRDKMISLGASVDAYDVRSVTKAYERALLKIDPYLFKKKTENYYTDILDSIRSREYDYVLFVKCDMPTEKVLTMYRSAFKNAKFCLHMWDSVKNIPHVVDKFRFFDYISSFDRFDSEQYSDINFRPLYYCDEYKKQNDSLNDYKYDLCFIGTIHSDRWKTLKIIKKKAESLGLSLFYYPYLQSKFIYYFYKLFKIEFWDTGMDEFKFERISSRDIVEKVSQSKMIIDIQHPRQSGLTIRTIEMIGLKKKILTTNRDIVNYDFYDPNNVCVIQRNKAPDLKTLDCEYHELDRKIYDNYSIEKWIYDVLAVNMIVGDKNEE